MRIAAYARYSSDQQSASSIDDQLRNCSAYATRSGWPAPVVYTDAAISGARHDRPAYQRMLADAHRFDVILVDDLSRLSRDSVESQTTIRRLTFAGVRVIGVSDGVDTGRKSHKADVGLRGLMSELYLDDLRDKTHRGLTGRALAGDSAGGLPYGYRVTERGKREIDEDQAAVVRRVYSEFLEGKSPRAIAIGLNRDRIPSARGSTWAMSAINGDMRRGIGLLANPIYCGRPIWNRSRWVKHPDTGRRVRQERPESEWIRQDHPELAIIDPATWDAVQARGRQKSGSPGGGRPHKYLLSGLLRCGECGGAMVMVNHYQYGCATAKDRGTCPGTARVARVTAETALLAGVQAELLTDAAFQRFQRAVAAAIKRKAPDQAALKQRMTAAERVRENVMNAIRAGIITPGTLAEVKAAEAEVDAAATALASATSSDQTSKIIPRLRDQWRAIVAAIGDRSRSIPAARAALQSLLGEVIVRNENGDLVAEIAASQSEITVVAGACFGRYLTAPLRIPLTGE